MRIQKIMIPPFWTSLARGHPKGLEGVQKGVHGLSPATQKYVEFARFYKGFAKKVSKKEARECEKYKKRKVL